MKIQSEHLLAVVACVSVTLVYILLLILFLQIRLQKGRLFWGSFIHYSFACQAQRRMGKRCVGADIRHRNPKKRAILKGKQIYE